MDRPSRVGSSCRRVHERRWVARGTAPRTPETPRASKGGGLPSAVLGKRFPNERIKFSSVRISLDLSIPASMLVFDEPRTKSSERLVIEAFNILFDHFNFAHGYLHSAPLAYFSPQPARRANVQIQRPVVGEQKGLSLVARVRSHGDMFEAIRLQRMRPWRCKLLRAITHA